MAPPLHRILITAGPTHEPIDAVRYLGNRSSGRLGVSLAKAAAARGYAVTLLLGPATIELREPAIELIRFRTAADLEALLETHFPACDVFVQAAAVADFRLAGGPGGSHTKLKRGDSKLVLELEPTPDLLAKFSAARRPGQVIIGFALEPAERLMASAMEKLARKRVDAVVANPLATMDSPTIEAALVRPGGAAEQTPGPIPKDQFATWLLDRIEMMLPAKS